MNNPIAKGGYLEESLHKITSWNMKPLKILLIILVSFFITCDLWSQSAGDYRSDADGDWNNANTWERFNGATWVDPSPDYPGQNSGTGQVEIRNGHTIDITASPANSIGSITIPGGNNSSWIEFTGPFSLTVTGSITLTGSSNNDYKYILVNSGTLYAGSIDMNSTGDTRDAFVEISTGSVYVSGNIVMNSADPDRNYIRFTDAGSLNIGGSISGGTITSNAGGGTAAPTNGFVNYTGTGAQNIGSYTYYSLGLTGSGPFTTAGNITVNGSFTLFGQLNSSNNITFNGMVNCGGTLNATAGTVTYVATSTNILGGIYYNLNRTGGGTTTLCDDIRVNNTLYLNTGIIQLGGSNLTMGAASNFTGSGTFSSTNMIETNSTGYFIKEGTSSAGLAMIYPVGSGGYYTRMNLTISSATIAGTGSIGVRAVPGYIGAGILSKYWDVITSNISAITAAPLFTYNNAEINGTEAGYASWFSETAGSWASPANASMATGSNTFGSTSTTALIGRWTAGSNQPVDPSTFYSYQTGDWNTASTWTTDPSGTTLVGSAVPGDNDIAVILSGRTVSLSGNITSTDLKIDIKNGGFLNMSTYSFTAGLGELKGQGTLQLASTSFPVVTSNDFVETNGGTTEYINTASFTLPAAQTKYNHLVINTSTGIIATQLSNISLNGNLHVKTGTFRINNDASSTKLQLTVLGDVTVDASASLTVGQGSTNTTITPTGISGGTAPYLNYYEHFHRIVLYGNFTNNGTVRFTNMSSPDYNNFPPLGSVATSGAASVYFMGSSNNTLFCNGTTDFYNLILDKGIDQTYSLTVQPTAYDHFRLFGANNATATINVAEPNLMKALWIRTGTLILKGLTVIPSLTEGTAANSDYYIPNSGALVIDGPDVIVLSTADDNGEANVAYGVSGTDGVNTAGAAYQGMVVYGKLQVNSGYLSTRESAGLLYSGVSSGLFEIAGGTIDSKQFRTYNTTTSGASYYQTGGTLILRGRFVRPLAYASISDLTSAGTLSNRAVNGTDDDYGTFNLNFSDNVYIMSGGTVRIYDACGSTGPEFIVDIVASAENTSVTGGTFELLPLTGSGLADAATHVIWTEAAPFGNMLVNRGSGCATLVRLRNKPLVVLNDLTLASGEFQANGQDVTIGGDFTVSSTATYSSTNNTTLSSTTDQNFTIDGTINNGAVGLANLIIDKSAGTLTLQGSQTSLTIQNNLDITGGTFADGGKTIYVAGNITHSGTHTGSGKIQLNGTTDQTIGGSGSGVFQNLELNNTAASAAPVSLTVNTTINGELTFSQNKQFDINNYNLTLNANASVTGANASRYVLTNGDAGDGSITKVFNTSTSFTFPLGVTAYTPASIGINGTPSAYGSITVIPVDYEHPNVTTTGRSLTYFWRVKSSGFTLGSATVTHGYSYVSGDVVTGGDIAENEYVAALYDYSTFTWTRGGTGDVDETNNIIGEPGSGTFLENTTFIDGDYTAGDDNPTNPFGTPTIYYSRQSGLWSNVNNWSLTGHTINNPPATVPGADDIVIIGGNDSIYLDRDRTDPWTTNNVDPRSCATLLIEAGSSLDIGYNTNSSFRMVQSHPNGNGNFRLTTSSTSGSTFVFPAGDFSDYDQNMGTTELYSTEPDPGTTYWLPNGKATYGNLILSPLGGSNIIFPNNDVTIYGNLITRGQNADSWFCPTWDGNYPTAPIVRVAKTITILGDMNIQGGALVWYGNGTIRQDFVIYGDVLVSPNSAIDVWSGATNQNISIGGSLINNTVGTTAGGTTTPRRCDFTTLPVTFFGDSSAFITNTMNSPLTIFSTLTINKGNSQNTTLTCDIDGTLTTPANNWLFLENGTFRFMRTDPSTNFTIS
ncbi:MAG: hypothetical protein JXA72_09035, partial [Bacteroidales bacterium]|nr:hypothetical protein [Bacteroidales bacterium]